MAQWLDGVIDPKTLEELPIDLLERRGGGGLEVCQQRHFEAFRLRLRRNRMAQVLQEPRRIMFIPTW